MDDNQVIEKMLIALLTIQNKQSELATIQNNQTNFIKNISETLHSDKIDEIIVKLCDKYVNLHIKEAVTKNTNGLSENIRNIIESVLTQNSLTEAGSNINKIVNDVERQVARLTEAGNNIHKTADDINKQIVSKSQETIETVRKTMKWKHRKIVASAAIVMIVAIFVSSWTFHYYRYREKLMEDRIRVANDIGENQEVLIELSKYNRRLSFMVMPDGENKGKKVLEVKNAEGYTTVSKAGLIVFD